MDVEAMRAKLMTFSKEELVTELLAALMELATPREWPKHGASLQLTHNDHKQYFLSVSQAVEEGDRGYRETDWVSPEQRQKAIETNDCWTLEWSTDSPLRSHLLTAADLDVLLAAAREILT